MWFRPNRRMNDLEERLDRLERAIRDLHVDWDSTYEKFARLNGRLAKRAKRELETPEPPDDGLDPISRAILAERGDNGLRSG